MTENRTKQILVTGGAGYIGSHTIIELIASGFDVISVDNYSNATPETYARIKAITGKMVAHEEVDLCDAAATEAVFQKYPNISGIIHFAALKSVPESVTEPLLYYRNNLSSLINLLACAEQRGILHFIFSSSCSVYGNVDQLPVNEHTPTGEIESPYAFTKLVGEKILQDFISKNKHPYKGISLRYFNPVGAHLSGKIGELPMNRPNNLVPIITQVAIGKLASLNVFGNDYDTRDGTCIRDYIHVSDIAKAHVLAIQHLIAHLEVPDYTLFNLGSGTGTSVLEAIAAFEKVSGVALRYEIAPRRPGDVKAIFSDSSKAKTILGWSPTLNIEEMMSSAWKWEMELSKVTS